MQTQSHKAASGPLSGIVVADLGRVLAAPYCSMILADLGARVIKVESPTGDDTRSWSPPQFEGESTYFLSVNRNKESITLDFQDSSDLKVAHDLVRLADVVIENFKPGGLKKFGLDYENTVRHNPSVVFASISGFGEGAGDLPGYDLLVQALSGLMHVTGDPSGSPYRSGLAVFDVMTGLHAAVGIVSAIYHRQATGEGQRITLDLLSSALSSMANLTGSSALTHVSPHRMGNEHPSIYPYAPFEASDGVVVIAVGNDRQFERLCAVIGVPALASDHRFTTNAERNRNRTRLREILAAEISQFESHTLFRRLRTAGVPAAPVLNVVEGINFAESLGLDPVVHVGTSARSVASMRNPVTFSRSPVTYRMPPPSLGQDSGQVRAWIQSSLQRHESE